MYNRAHYYTLVIVFAIVVNVCCIDDFDGIGYQEPVQCEHQSDCPLPKCSTIGDWVSYYCSPDKICKKDVVECDDNVLCTVNQCRDESKCKQFQR